MQRSRSDVSRTYVYNSNAMNINATIYWHTIICYLVRTELETGFIELLLTKKIALKHYNTYNCSQLTGFILCTLLLIQFLGLLRHKCTMSFTAIIRFILLQTLTKEVFVIQPR